MNRRRTLSWWLVRLELAAGIGLTLLVGRLGMESALTMSCYCNPPAHPLPLPPNAMLAFAALATAAAGLFWMVRIILSSLDDEPLRWRYRDR